MFTADGQTHQGNSMTQSCRCGLAALVLLLVHGTANAERILTVESIAVPYSPIAQVGSLEVYIQQAGELPVELIAFQIQVHLAPEAAGVTLTGIDLPGNPYVFPGSAPIGAVGGDASVVDGGDFLLFDSGFLADGDGFFRINYTIAAGVLPQSFSLIVDTDPANTFLTDAQFDDVPFSVQNGGITVVPEPPSLFLSILALFCVMVTYLYPRSRSRLAPLR